MTFCRARWIRIAILGLFVGFQSAQVLHAHAAAVTDESCAVCQVVHHTPTVGAPPATVLHTVVTSQALLAVRRRGDFAFRLSRSVLSRAPPAL
jgi:hypothetical protein